MANGWPEGSMGEMMNEPEKPAKSKSSNNASSKFKPIEHKKTGNRQINQMAARTAQHVEAATPSERRAGARFYDRARRDAFHISRGVDPGLAGSPEDKNSARRPGRTRDFNAVMDERGKVAPPHERQEGITRAAHQIAALSPSMPAGMTWRENPRAAHAVQGLTDETLGMLHRATEAHSREAQLGGLKRKVKNNYGEDSNEYQAALEQHKSAHAAYRRMNDDARSQPDIEKTELKHAGSESINAAARIGRKLQPGVESEVKTGAFAETIARPRHIGGGIEASTRSTIDGRSHDIMVGKHLNWETNRGLGTKGRYAVFEEGNRRAGEKLGMHPHQAQAISWIQDDNAQKNRNSAGNRAMGRGVRRTGDKIRVSRNSEPPQD